MKSVQIPEVQSSEHQMSRSVNARLRIEGTVAPGFESVKDLYTHNMQTLEERNTQLCVYHKGEKVVDLWATAIGDERFSPDSLVNVFSSGKSLEAIAMASLVDKGLLDYDAKVADYWPEFGANGKEHLTIADLMRHEAGLAVFNTSIEAEDLLVENIKLNRVGKIIEDHSPAFRKGAENRREYHALTRGWIVNEVFRRVDPVGRTIGEFLREDLSGPLEADATVGVKEADLGRVSRVAPLGFLFQLLESLKPRFMGRRIELNIFQILGRLIGLLPAIRNATTLGAPRPFKGMEGIGHFNKPAIAMGETPSANAHCSARGLARIAAMMAANGIWHGKVFLGEKAWQAMHHGALAASMGFTHTDFTQGGVNAFIETNASSSHLDRAFNDGRQGFFGWMGLGGSLFQWHPRHEIGFGYVPTSLNVLDFLNERGKTYQAEVLRCVERSSAS